jgi:hypothetical protein
MLRMFHYSKNTALYIKSVDNELYTTQKETIGSRYWCFTSSEILRKSSEYNNVLLLCALIKILVNQNMLKILSDDDLVGASKREKA